MQKKIALHIITIIVALLFVLAFQKPVIAKASHRLVNYTSNSAYEYTLAEVKYVYNGSEIDLGNNIGYLSESGSAMGPLVDIFQKSLGLPCEYNISDGTITLSSNSVIISFKIGSKNALVNGKSVTMTEAPVIVKLDDNSSKIYVPTRFMASNLGYAYNWSKETSTVTIEKVYSIIYSSDAKETPLEIPLFSDTTEDMISVTENFTLLNKTYINEFTLTIKGNHSDQYEKNAFVNHYSCIKDISLGTNSEGDTYFKFTTNIVRGIKFEIKDNILYLTLDDPSNIYDKIIILDPGHGGYDVGATRSNIYESRINYGILYTYIHDLFEDSGIKVYYTRETDVYSHYTTRAAWAKQINPDFYISLHCNANDSAIYKGTNVYFSSKNNKTLANGLSSKVMASLFLDRICSSIDLQKNYVGNADYTVLCDNSVPSILIEIAFMSNPDDLTKLVNTEFQKSVSKVIYDTILEIYEVYPFE